MWRKYVLGCLPSLQGKTSPLFSFFISFRCTKQCNRYLNPRKVITHPPSYYPSDILFGCYNTINYLPYVVLHIQWLYIFICLVIVDIQYYSTSALQGYSTLVRYLHSLWCDPLWVQTSHSQGWAPGSLIVQNIPDPTPATMMGPSKRIRCFLQRFHLTQVSQSDAFSRSFRNKTKGFWLSWAVPFNRSVVDLEAIEWCLFPHGWRSTERDTETELWIACSWKTGLQGWGMGVWERQ